VRYKKAVSSEVNCAHSIVEESVSFVSSMEIVGLDEEILGPQGVS
jgi:hypothetical protein